MTRSLANNPRACEPCRRAKLRCSGGVPCRRCQTRPLLACSYRVAPRKRQSTIDPSVSAVAPPVPIEHENTGRLPTATLEGNQYNEIPSPEDTPEALYHSSVTASQSTTSDSIFASRLFYGPSSTFSFHQQVLRALADALVQCSDKSVNGAKLFSQHAFFFGTPLGPEATGWDRGISPTSLRERVPPKLATTLIEGFEASVHFQLPIFSPSEIRHLIAEIYSGETTVDTPQKAVALAILAVGTTSTTNEADLGDFLYHRARQEAILCEGASIGMIQCYLLLAHYQDCMGRPDSAHAHSSSALQKARAMGLPHDDSLQVGSRSTSFSTSSPCPCPDAVNKARIAIWSTYASETLRALRLGRPVTLKRADISTPFPEGSQGLVGLCKLAKVAEDISLSLYTRRCSSLWKLYQEAVRVHGQLEDCARELGIGPAGGSHNNNNSAGGAGGAGGVEPIARLQYHNVYYHLLSLTFRPFLIADFALRFPPRSLPLPSSSSSSTSSPSIPMPALSSTNHRNHHNQQSSQDETTTATTQNRSSSYQDVMWLRHASRLAVDAAQDTIVFASTAMMVTSSSDSPPSSASSSVSGSAITARKTRFGAFYLECACMLLVFDTVRHGGPSKLPLNRDYIDRALRCLRVLACAGTAVGEEDDDVEGESGGEEGDREGGGVRPVCCAIRSIRDIWGVVEGMFGGGGGSGGGSGSSTSANLVSPLESDATVVPTPNGGDVGPKTAFREQQHNFPSFTGYVAGQQGLPMMGDVHSGELGQAPGLVSNHLGFQHDVFTTDLLDFFSVNALDPSLLR